MHFVSFRFIPFHLIQQRTPSALLQREKNIRKDIGKLMAFSKGNITQTGGGILPNKNPPSISFQLSNVIEDYCQKNSVKLLGLETTFDADETAAAAAAADQELQPENVQIDPYDPILEMANMDESLPSPSALPTSSNDVIAQLPNEWSSSSESTTNTSTASPIQEIVGRSQFFLTKQQQDAAVTGKKRKKQKTGHDDIYYTNKSLLIKQENDRRKEMHDMDIKLKQAQLNFFDYWQQEIKSRAQQVNANIYPFFCSLYLSTRSFVNSFVSFIFYQMSIEQLTAVGAMLMRTGGEVSHNSSFRTSTPDMDLSALNLTNTTSTTMTNANNDTDHDTPDDLDLSNAEIIYVHPESQPVRSTASIESEHDNDKEYTHTSSQTVELFIGEMPSTYDKQVPDQLINGV